MSDWDNLRLCSVCGDRETTSDICWSCRLQEQIDNSDYVPTNCPKCKSFEVVFDFHDNCEFWTCEKCDHVWQGEC